MRDEISAHPRPPQHGHTARVRRHVPVDAAAQRELVGETEDVNTDRARQPAVRGEHDGVPPDLRVLARDDLSTETVHVPGDRRLREGKVLGEADHAAADVALDGDGLRGSHDLTLYGAADIDAATERDQVAGHVAVDFDVLAERDQRVVDGLAGRYRQNALRSADLERLAE